MTMTASSPAHVREALVTLLLNDGAAATACAARLAQDGGWDAVCELAELWNVVPNLRARLATLRTELPPRARQNLFERFQRSFAAATLEARRGVVMCRYLEDQGIPVVVFKGLASIAHLYRGAPSERMIKDVDLLIRPQDLEPALKALQAAGMQREDGGSLNDYLAFVKNSPGFAGNEAITLRGDGQADLDVHWSFGPQTHPEFQADAIVARSEMVSLFGTSIRVSAPGDGLMLSAHHSIRETFAPDHMLRDVLDTARWLDLLEARGSLGDALRRAELCRMDTPVLALAEILVHRSGRRRVAPPRAAVSHLATLFEAQVSEGPIAKDFTYLADGHAIRQIVTGVLGGWKRYRAQMAAFETQLSGEPLPLRERLALRVQQLRRFNARRWRLLRTLARAKSAYQRHR
jgi:hypothetical protein